MADRQQWLTRVKDVLGNSHLVSNVAFGFILMGLEKLVELEFQCPCNPKWNALFSSGFFIIPAVMAFTLMLLIDKRRSDPWFRKAVSSSAPAIVWLILLFFDGQYFACAMTYWNGIFVVVDKDAKIKWCKPDDSPDKQSTTQKFYSLSQGIGECLLFVICVGLIVYVIQGYYCRSGEIEAERDPPPGGDPPPGPPPGRDPPPVAGGEEIQLLQPTTKPSAPPPSTI